VHSGATVAAGAVVRNRTEVPSGAVAMGVPAIIRPDASDVDEIRRNAESYVMNMRRYKNELRRL
jgi:carbonic anhydrase/acetyltransferase-like protein (isoleucine patch superfamily)